MLLQSFLSIVSYSIICSKQLDFFSLLNLNLNEFIQIDFFGQILGLKVKLLEHF